MEKKSVLKKITGSREASLVIVLAVLLIVVTIINPAFMSVNNIMEILKNNSITLILALGMLCVLLVGGIDISIASTLAFGGMASGLMIKYGMLSGALMTPLAFIISMAIGTVCGIIVGVIVGYGNVPPIIATMGGMYIFRAMAYIIGNSQWAGADALGDFKLFATSNFLGLNKVIWVVIICYVIFYVVLKWTKFGRNIYAVGSNSDAAQISGINVAKVKVQVYAIMGLLSGLCGALATTIYASAQPSMQQGKEMDVIAACVIGGVSMSGGKGTVPGALLGALILAVIGKALPLVHIDALAQNTVKGVLIVVVIILNVMTQRTLDKQNLERREK